MRSAARALTYEEGLDYERSRLRLALVTACMSEPEVYGVMAEQARRVQALLSPAEAHARRAGSGA